MYVCTPHTVIVSQYAHMKPFGYIHSQSLHKSASYYFGPGSSSNPNITRSLSAATQDTSPHHEEVAAQSRTPFVVHKPAPWPGYDSELLRRLGAKSFASLHAAARAEYAGRGLFSPARAPHTLSHTADPYHFISSGVPTPNPNPSPNPNPNPNPKP